MNHKWSLNILTEEPNENVYSSIEIDESSIIGNSQVEYWISWLIQKNSKKALIFCLLNNRTKENLLPYIIKNVEIAY